VNRVDLPQHLAIVAVYKFLNQDADLEKPTYSYEFCAQLVDVAVEAMEDNR